MTSLLSLVPKSHIGRKVTEMKILMKFTCVQQQFQKASYGRKKTLYDILHVNPDATPDEIKTAYISLCKVYHPDLHTNMTKEASNTNFKEIVDAYEVLGNEKKKQEYDNAHAKHRRQVRDSWGFQDHEPDISLWEQVRILTPENLRHEGMRHPHQGTGSSPTDEDFESTDEEDEDEDMWKQRRNEILRHRREGHQSDDHPYFGYDGPSSRRSTDDTQETNSTNEKTWKSIAKVVGITALAYGGLMMWSDLKNKYLTPVEQFEKNSDVKVKKASDGDNQTATWPRVPFNKQVEYSPTES